MLFQNAKKTVEQMLFLAGIKINGKNPWDIKVHNEKFYSRIMGGGSLALGESYMDGWWDCDVLEIFIEKILNAGLDKRIPLTLNLFWYIVKAKVLNLQTKTRAWIVGKEHYDIGNDLYTNMLDKRMNYSCAYWKKARNLDSAQEDKLELICKKLKLEKGMKVLDIGCGWGAFAKYAAQKYKVKVVGITVSKEQQKLAQNLCKGLDVKIKIQDYRDLNEKFDRIMSVGMFEHVGSKNYRQFFEVVSRCLKDDGFFLLHTIGGDFFYGYSDPWIDKYIFPNGMIPSPKQITEAAEGLFTLEDWHNFGFYYYNTLMAWYKNFKKNRSKFKGKYDERFYRMWKYYLLSCAGSFKSHKNHLRQIVFSKVNAQKFYDSIR